MAGIKGKNTKPELLVRKGLHRLGFRYSLHDKKLPGKPDLVLPKYRAVIFVNGCFWHMHDCHLFKWPKTRKEFWRAKLEGNVTNDERVVAALKKDGWRIMTIWECALKGKTMKPLEEVLYITSQWLNTDGIEAVIRGEPWGECRNA